MNAKEDIEALLNSEDIKVFQETEKLLGTNLPQPTTSEINETILDIEDFLELKKINRTKNQAVKEGYTKAVEILKDRETSKELVSDIVKGEFVNYPVEDLRTIQGRAIASLAYDYLAGKCTKQVLCGVPIKD